MGDCSREQRSRGEGLMRALARPAGLACGKLDEETVVRQTCLRSDVDSCQSCVNRLTQMNYTSVSF